MFPGPVLAALAASVSLADALTIIPNATAPGTVACRSLTSSLGLFKVDSNPLSPIYLASQNGYWNAEQSRYSPSCVVYPTSAQDVSTALKTIKAAGSRFAVKTAGHNPNTFFSSVDQGVLIDLNRLTAKTYDKTTTLGTFQPGGTFGDVYNYFAPYGRTVVGARLAGVGTGLALGGGLSFLSGQYGMACDSFRELEIVVPSGDIVTASPTQNADLFFASRGGGGNAYGVVTKYTVQTRPSGTFYAGNMIYSSDQTQRALQAMYDFTVYNTDPKAAIIGTFEQFSGSDPTVLMFLVYDGPDAGTAFENFTSIPSILNTMSKKSYVEVVNMPLPGAAGLSRGNNVFRVGVHRVGDDSYQVAYDAWLKWNTDHKGQYSFTSIDFQPIAKSLTDASKAQNGGNAMQMPDGPWYWLNYLITTPSSLTTDQYDAVQASYRDMVNSIPNAAGLPLFINDANKDQDALKTFSTYSRLQAIKKKYDPDGFFSSSTGGWSFD